MKKKNKKLLSVVLAIAMVISMLPMTAFAGNAPTSNLSGLSITFVSTNGGSDPVDKVILNSSKSVTNDVYVKVVNNTNQTATITGSTITQGFSLIAQGTVSEIAPDAAAYYKVFGTGTSSNVVATVTVKYTLESTFNSSSSKYAFTSTGYIYCEYKAPETSAFAYVEYNPTQSKNRFRHYLMVDGAYADSVWISLASSSKLTTASPSFGFAVYVDREKAGGSWSGIALKYRMESKYTNRPKWESSPTWTGSGSADSPGEFQVSGIKDGNKDMGSKVVDGTYFDYDVTGTIPTGSSTSASPYVFESTNFSYSANSGIAWSTVNVASFKVSVYAYNKSNLRTQLNFYEKLGLNRALYSSSSWSSFTTALSNARKILGTSKTNQKAVVDAVNNLTTAYDNLSRGSYCLTQVDKLHTGDKNTTVSAANTRTRYFILTTGSSITVPYNEDFAGLYNKATNQTQLTVPGENVKNTYEYWIIDFDGLNEQLAASQAYLGNSDLYSPSSYESFTSAYANAYAYDQSLQSSPEAQSEVNVLTNSLKEAISKLEENADYTAWDAAYATIPQNYFTNKEYYFTPYSYGLVDEALEAFPGRGLGASYQDDIDRAAQTLEAAVAELRYNPADTEQLEYYLYTKFDEMDLYGSYTYDSVEYFNYSEDSLNEFDAALDGVLQEYENGTWDIRDQAKIDVLTQAAGEAYNIPVALMNEGQANTIGTFVKAYEDLTDNTDNYCNGASVLAEYADEYAAARDVLDAVESLYSDAQQVADSIASFEANKHSYDEGVVTAPTCTEQGYTTYTCTVCSDVLVSDYVKELGHNYVQTARVEPDCVTKGSVTFTCSRCNDSYDDELPALGHDYKSVVTAPTCTEQGYTTHTCSRCDDTFVDTYTDKLGHNYVEVSRKDATCTTTGNVSYKCSRCGDEYSEELPVLGHDYKSVVTEPTCTAQGYTTHTCSRCQSKYIDSYTNALGHDYVSTVVLPTITERGYTRHTCTRCGDSYDDTFVPALGEASFNVVFYNYDGSIIDRKTVKYGEDAPLPDNPQKPSDETYTYEFVGWEGDYTNVTENREIYAKFEQKYIEYKVTFNNEDGSPISEKTYHYGDEVAEPETPVKEADNTFTYTFDGWDKEIETVSRDITYTATFRSEYINYSVTFEDYNGSLISGKTDYHYGDVVEVPVNPVREADNTYTYEFAGWTPEVTNVTGNATYVATYNSTYIDYTVRFENEDGSEISEKTYHYGDVVELPETPVKEADNTYTYAFAGWSPEVTSVTDNATYVAVFESEYINYSVTFVDYNGELISQKTDYHYGDTVVLPETPVREADNTYTYEFSGWSPEVTDVAGNVTYTAGYTSTYIDYTVKFVNFDDSLISEKTYHYGDAVEIPETPVKSADNTYTYEFAGWDKEVSAEVFESVTYKATFNPVYIDYTVKFVNYDDSLISEKTYHYGDTVEVPETPVKAADNTYTYEFASWDSEVTPVAGSVTYKATFNPVYIDYTVKFVNYDDSLISEKTYHYGDTVEVPETPVRADDENYYYVFSGWSPEVSANVTGSVIYIAQFTAHEIKADYTAVDLAQQAANELESGMYTTVSYARVTKALSEVVRGLKVWEQERVDAMAQAINDAIDALVSTTEYDAILATCLAVNNDTNAYTTASYEKFTQAMAKIDVSKDFNTETATQADVDAAAQELSQAYALLEANHMEIVGADEQLTIGESKAFVIGVNTNIDTTKLKAEDGGANVAYLKYLDAKGNVITNSKKSLSTGCTVQLMFGGEVIESYVIVVYGDINGDGQVTVSDIMKAKAMKNSTEGFSEYQIEAAKCGTESINVEMVTELAKRV